MAKKMQISCLITMFFMIIGCAALSQWYSQTHYETFELTFDGEKKIVNLPDELPSMSEAVLAGEQCFNVEICRQRFCVTKDIGHDHVDFVFVDSDVIALVWIKEAETDMTKRFVAWIYVEKKPVAAPIDAINELIKKHSPN